MILPGLEVAAACCKEVVVWVPVDAEDGRTNRLLDVLAHPPGSKKIKNQPMITCPRTHQITWGGGHSIDYLNKTRKELLLTFCDEIHVMQLNTWGFLQKHNTMQCGKDDGIIFMLTATHQLFSFSK